MPELPMFPLGTVLLPHMVLPLHIFEPRYRVLLHDVLDAEDSQREFGVTLITRGHEVGGGDQRAEVGAVARILQAQELEDGRWIVVAVGTRRIRVQRWLPEDPYPVAEVEELPSAPPATGAAELLTELEPQLRRSLAMLSELGEEGVPSTFELANDPEEASWQAAVILPFNPYDAQRILETDEVTDRLRLISSLVADLDETLAFRLQDE